MGDETATPEAGLTELFNGSAQPLVLQWGEGVVMPGESFKTDKPEGYAPDQPGSPWTTDAEAARAVLRLQQSQTTNPSDSSQDGHSEAAGGLSGPQDAPPLIAPNPGVSLVGDEVVDGQGNVVGHIVPEQSADQAATTQPQ